MHKDTFFAFLHSKGLFKDPSRVRPEAGYREWIQEQQIDSRDLLRVCAHALGLPVIDLASVYTEKIGDQLYLQGMPYRLTSDPLDALQATHTVLVDLWQWEQQQQPLLMQMSDFTEHLLHLALQKKASDIHIEHYEGVARIRLRVDGLLQMTSLADYDHVRLISRLKILAHLNIAEHRLPQDGRFAFANKDCRLSIYPTQFGEKAVIRLLDTLATLRPLHALGFLPEQYDLFLRCIQKPNGLILVTGPTGSGKSTTLYAALHALNTSERNICTLEDPIEMQLSGINQTNILDKAGLSFATLLRGLLRQDPDIIMIGEIRDSVTAETACQAAMSGHLVFATLHTNNAIESLARLQQMGVKPYHIAHAMQLIVAQRLLRVICPHCRASGCAQCFQGYAGRIAVYELLPIDSTLKMLLEEGAPMHQLLQHTVDMQTLWHSALQQEKTGLIDRAEMQRVLWTSTL